MDDDFVMTEYEQNLFNEIAEQVARNEDVSLDMDEDVDDADDDDDAKSGYKSPSVKEVHEITLINNH